MNANRCRQFPNSSGMDEGHLSSDRAIGTRRHDRGWLTVEPGCRTGGCGECVTEYVEGDVIHKDACLQITERDRYFCPCVSRAKTRIVIAA